MKEIEPSQIKVEKFKEISHEDISKTNELKYKQIDKKYGFVYNETKKSLHYKSVIDGDSENLILTILDSYYESKKLSPSSKITVECIKKLIKSIEYQDNVVDRNDFLCKLTSIVDFVNEYEDFE